MGATRRDTNLCRKDRSGVPLPPVPVGRAAAARNSEGQRERNVYSLHRPLSGAEVSDCDFRPGVQEAGARVALVAPPDLREPKVQWQPLEEY